MHILTIIRITVQVDYHLSRISYTSGFCIKLRTFWFFLYFHGAVFLQCPLKNIMQVCHAQLKEQFSPSIPKAIRFEDLNIR